MRFRTFIFVFLVLLIPAAFAWSQTGDQKEDINKNRRYLHEWVDDRGNLHVTDDLGNVPEKYRERVKQKFEARPKKGAGQAGKPEEPAAPALLQPPAQEKGAPEEAGKAHWQNRIREWKDRLADAEKHYQELEQKRNELIGRWGILAYAPAETRAEVARVEQEMQEVQKQIDEARNMIENVIPEEARKAGVPPGWLRE